MECHFTAITNDMGNRMPSALSFYRRPPSDVIHGPYGLVSMLRHWHNKVLNLLDNMQPFLSATSQQPHIRSPATLKCPFFLFLPFLSSHTQVHSLPDSILFSVVLQKRWRGSLTNSWLDRKMFIGGLNWETTDRMHHSMLIVLRYPIECSLTLDLESLRDYFSEFGEVQECTVMRDSASGRSRGFGFLTFRDPKTVNTVMVKEHYLDGKIVSS